MSKPTIRELVEATGVSRTYACDVLNGKQHPRGLVVEIYRKFGWKAPLIAHMTDDQIDVIEAAEKLAPSSRAA
jgi:hypothetical protein